VARRVAAIALCLAAPALAEAAAWDVEARTEAQVFDIPRASPLPGGWDTLTRRRLVQYLDVAGFEILPGEDAGLSLALRFDGDLGISSSEEAGIDGVKRTQLQLLAGRLHWKGMARGLVDVEAGRIAAQGPVSFFAFDGARVTVRPLAFLALTAFGGLRVTGGSWLGSPVASPDGVRDSDARRLAAGLPPFPCPSVPGRACADPTLDDASPTWGVRLAATQLPGGFASGAYVEYRRTQRAGGAIEEQLGGGLRYQVGPVAFDGATEYDLYLARLSALRLALRWGALGWLSLSAEGSSWQTSFSADSIFNLYDTAPWKEARLRADVAPADWPVRVYASGGLQWIDPTRFGEEHFQDHGGTAPLAALGASWRSGETLVLADLDWRSGLQGRAGFASASARRSFQGWLTLDLRGTLASIDDPVTPSHNGTFLSGALLVSGRLERRARVSIVIEDSATRFGRNDLRLYALFDLGVDWDSRLR
jgi:hypothetical protein